MLQLQDYPVVLDASGSFPAASRANGGKPGMITA